MLWAGNVDFLWTLNKAHGDQFEPRFGDQLAVMMGLVQPYKVTE